MYLKRQWSWLPKTKSSMKELVKAIQEIAKKNPKGFTVAIPDLEPVRFGWAIGHKETQNSHGVKGLKKVIAHSLKTTKVVGGWSGYSKYFYDTVSITFTESTLAKLFKKQSGGEGLRF